MGRHFVGGSAENIYVTSGGLKGFSFLFGTFAAWVNLTSYSGDQGIVVTNDVSGARFALYLSASLGNAFDYWDGSNDRSAAGPAAGVTTLIGITKASGTQTARSHKWVPSTGTMTHAALNGTSVNSAATASLAIGAGSIIGIDAFTGDMWQVAMWNAVVMSDGEWERLARWSDWSRFAPDFYHRDSDGREVGDMSRTMGRYKVTQTSRTGTSRGTLTPPPGFGSSARRRRS